MYISSCCWIEKMGGTAGEILGDGSAKGYTAWVLLYLMIRMIMGSYPRMWTALWMYVGANTFVCTCGSQRSVPGIFLCYSPPYFMSQGLSLSLELIYSARLAGQQALEIHLSLFTQHWDYRHVPPRLDFTWMRGTWTQVLMLVQDALCPRTHLLVPQKQGFCFYFLKSSSVGNVKKKREGEEVGASAGGT